MKVRKAIIPAAGLGTRVLPASKAVPKEMLNIVDKPAIQYIVEEAVAAGIEDILIITNRGKGVIEDHFDHSFELEANLAGNPSKAKLYEDVKSVANLANIYFIRQKETKGLAHAILCGKSFVGDEPFAVLYGDDVIISDDPVTAQLVRCYEKYGKGVVGVNEVSEELIRLYCTLGVSPIEGEDRAMNCSKIIEKPTPEQILSLYAILGRVVLPPEVFGMIEKGIAETPAGGEFLLTDVFTELGMNGKLLAYDFDGRRYDMGNKLGIMKANCEVALSHPEIGDGFKEYLKELVKTF
ncbi:MAG: UTP--glucose-1-phosphate uridylyltransferase [Oscillospiraceae bacterium]|nr:UTP--glucose-1-phosphate uridylyltransferase [Clostridiaceae bacterium]MDO4495753.1 UTP--glucose-1-phosphate uridylyltransferase [Clostridiaceae bacterium]MDY5948424.1 UTP--glucose-1-phosphate uridylyltransferase [Oscillospiraceae bacterium]